MAKGKQNSQCNNFTHVPHNSLWPCPVDNTDSNMAVIVNVEKSQQILGCQSISHNGGYLCTPHYWKYLIAYIIGATCMQFTNEVTYSIIRAIFLQKNY